MKPLRLATIMICSGLMAASFPAFSRDSDQTRDKLRIYQVESSERSRSADKERTTDRVQDRDKDPDQLPLKDKDCAANIDCDPQQDRDRDSKPDKYEVGTATGATKGGSTLLSKTDRSSK